MENTQTHKLAFNKFGLTENPVGGHCVLEHKGIELLGEVKEVVRNESRGFTFLRVVFMNGEAWPIQPTAASVNMLERTYEAA